MNRRTVALQLLLVIVLSTCHNNILITCAAQGVAHTTVQVLTADNFDKNVLSDPANGLWFLKFYAPWCGHCKKMAPTLDKVAPYLSGKMAIGKIDCTQYKPLCSRYGVSGFPTLKVYRDGDVFDYPGERHADAIIEFAEKMSASAVALVSSYDDAMSTAKNAKNGVAFLAYDPSSKGDEIEDMLLSSTILQVFGQIARKKQAFATFGLFGPNVSKGDIAKLGVGTKSFIAKVEQGVKPTLYVGEPNSPDFLDFVKSENIALVTQLGSNNFRDIANMGKSLAIAVVDPKAGARTEEFSTKLRTIAANSDSALLKKVTFCSMDGVKWAKFLKQFNVGKLPAFFILDYPRKLYYDPQPEDDSAEPLGMEEFLAEFVAGKLVPREQGSGNAKAPFYLNQYFLFAVVAIIMTLFFLSPLGSVETEAIEREEKKKNSDTLAETKKES